MRFEDVREFVNHSGCTCVCRVMPGPYRDVQILVRDPECPAKHEVNHRAARLADR